MAIGNRNAVASSLKKWTFPVCSEVLYRTKMRLGMGTGGVLSIILCLLLPSEASVAGKIWLDRSKKCVLFHSPLSDTFYTVPICID